MLGSGARLPEILMLFVFAQVYTSDRWLVRIYKVKDRDNVKLTTT